MERSRELHTQTLLQRNKKNPERGFLLWQDIYGKSSRELNIASVSLSK